MADLVIFPKNTNKIELNGLLDEDATESLGVPTYVNDATVTFSVADLAGNTVPNSSIDLNYVASSNGNYHGTVSNAFNPRPGGYLAIVDAVSMDGVMHLEVPTEVQPRTTGS